MARFCAACGTPLGDETARFCAKCGAAVAAPPTPSATTTSPGASRSVGSSRNDKTLSANGPKPVVAGILAGLFPFGVGAVYLGQYVRAWTYLAIVVGLSIGRHQSSTLSIICSLTFFVLWVWPIVDAVRTAKALRSVGGITGTSTIKRAVCVAALVLTLIAVPNLLQNGAARSQQNSPATSGSPTQEDIEAHNEAMRKCIAQFREAGYGGDLTSTCEETVDKYLPLWRKAVSH